MRLGFHYHVPAVQTAEGIRMPGYQGRFVDALAHYCREVVCFLHSPVQDEIGLMDYRIASRNVRLVSLGPHSSVPSRLLRAHAVRREIAQTKGQLDAMLLRGPSPLLPLVMNAISPVPTALLLVGNMLEGIQDLPQPRWRKELIRLFFMWNAWAQRRAARRCLVFVNSRKLYEKTLPFAGRLIETQTTTLSGSDFFEREDTCTGSPKHLLYTGRLTRAKGLLEIVQALAVLVAKGEDVVLDVVGWAEGKEHSILKEIEERSVRLGVADRVRYHGFRPVGPELFAFYRSADIYVIASTNEGFPRTIWEAMAHSLPVVATRVGSIPDFVGDAAELVEPGQVEGLVSALSRILHDSKRRKEMICLGLKLAKENTLDRRASEMVLALANWAFRHIRAKADDPLPNWQTR